MAEAGIERGHRISLFHRGRTGAHLFPGCEHLLGDRDADLELLADRSWDAAIDVCAYVPRQVKQAANALNRSVDCYCLVSTVSAFDCIDATSLNEDSVLLGAANLRDPATETVDAETYGPLKALCEAEAHAGFDGRVLIIRPTYVVGPHDITDRFTYWVRRVASGGEIMAAAPRDAPIQLIDARDLGVFTIRLLEEGASGPYCAAGPSEPITWVDMLDVCLRVTEAPGWVTWVDPAFLRHHRLEVETAMPLWRPPKEFGLMRCDAGRSRSAGLTCRPLEMTVGDTGAWDVARGLPALAGPLAAAQERRLLAAWHSRQLSTGPS